MTRSKKAQRLGMLLVDVRGDLGRDDTKEKWAIVSS